MATTERHLEISEQFLEHAEVEFAKGDLLQASEKAWGAVAHYIKAVAQAQGWEHNSHYLLWRNANRLLPLTDDPELNRLRKALIDQLHVNFYEEKFPSEDIRRSIDNANLVIDAFKMAESRL